MGWGGGLLHSHAHSYPTGSTQQQMTCYHYKDENNEWLVLPSWKHHEYNVNDPIQYLEDGHIIRLSHKPTTPNMHSHVVPAPDTKNQHEVSAYGNTTVGDDKDHWRIEVVDDV